MLLYRSSWQEMIASLPPGEQAEILAALTGHRDGKDEDPDDSTP